jgi:hypothetical protein
LAAAAALTLACELEAPDTPGGGAGGAGAGSGGTSAGSAGNAGKSGSGGAGTGGAGAPGGTGGKAGAGAGGSAGSSAGTGGSAGSGSGSGGSLSGAGGGSGGSAGSSAGTGGGGSGGTAGSPAGGAGGAGTGGTAGSGGTGGGSGAVASAGCGKSGRPSGGVVTVNNDHIYNFPESYDGNEPFPLLIGLHAAGNPIDQIQMLTNGSEFTMTHVRAFPKSAGNEWVYNTDIAKVLGMYDDLVENYCIDTSRVFATGHSSGAQMIVQILMRADATEHLGFKAVAPVAASNYGAIMSPIPVMYIQGRNDSVRNSDGADVVARFTTVNGCSTTTMEYAGAPACMRSGRAVDAGCVSYEGCSEPTVWCSHDDPEYSNTNHGWPCFATDAMYDFFAALP